MKSLKKRLGLLVGLICIVCSGCDNNTKQSLAPVEDSGEKAIGTGVSVSLPKGWRIVDNAMAAGKRGIVITKDLSTVTVIVGEVPGLSTYSLDEAQAIFEEKLKEKEAVGAKVVSSSQETLETAEAIFFELENTVTQEMINQNINSGIYSEDAAKGARVLIDKMIYEGAYYIIDGDNMIVIDAVTYNNDVTGIKNVATFISNSVQLF